MWRPLTWLDPYPLPLTWDIFQIIIDYLFLVVIVYIFKPIIRSLVLNDALHPTITMSFKLKGKNNNPLVLDTLDEDDLDVGIELKSLIVNMKKEMCGVIDFSFPS